MNNEFRALFQAALDRVKTLLNFKNDIKSIEAKLPKIKVQGTLDSKTKGDLLKKFKNITAKIKVDADTKQAESKIEKLTKKQRYVNISPKVNNTQLASDFKSTEKQAQSFFDKFTNNIAGLNVLRIAFYKVAQAASKAVENVKGLNIIKTNIQTASQVSTAEADNMMKTYNQMGKEISSTTKKVAESADEFIRMGESVSSTNELIKNAQMLSAIGKIENSDAASYLISGMRGYEIAAEDSVKIVDKLTAADMEAAVSAGGLAEALSKTSNIANTSGVSLDRLIGYVSVVGETTQKSMSEVGNSFQSIFSRMNNIKINRFVDDETGESLSDTETVLNKLGIKLRDTSDTYRDFDDVLDDVGQKWNTFTQVEQNAISVAMAGTRQRENFTALMNRYGDALKYTEVAANSSGTAMKRYEQYQDSIDAKTNELTNSLEALSMNTISEDLYKDILEATTGIIEFTDKTNLLKGSLAGLATYGASKMFVTMASGIISAARSTAQLTSVMAMFNNGRSAENLEAIGMACQGLTDNQMKLVLSTSGLTNMQRLLILQGKGVEESQRQQTLTTLGFSHAEKTATASTFSFAGALNSLKVAFASNPVGMAIMAVTTAVTIGTMAYSSYKQSLEDMRRETSEAANTFNEATSSVNDYADKYKKLHDELTKANTSEERQHEIKSELLSLQQDLNEKYGDEYGKLNLVTDAYKDQTEAILAMNKASAQKFLNENVDGIEDAKEQMTSKNTYMVAEDIGMYSESGSSILDLAKQMGLDVDANESTGTFTVRVKADATGAYDSITDFMNKVTALQESYGKDDSDIGSVLGLSSSSLNSAKDKIDGNADKYKSALEAEITVNDKLSRSFDSAKNSVKEYNDALASGDDAKILSARDNLNIVKSSIDLSSSEWKDYASVINDVFSQADTGLYDFRDAITANENEMQSFIKSIGDSKLSEEDLFAMADDGNPDYFDQLIKEGEKYGLTVQQIINELVRMGIVQGDVAKSGEVVSADFATMFSNLPVDKIEKYISLLNSGDMTEGNVSSFAELNDLMSQTSMSAEGAVKAIKDYAEGFTLSADLISNIQGAFDLLKDVEEQYKKTGLIGLSSLESIAKQYPQLQSSVNEYTQGLIGADEVMSQLHTAYDNDAESFRTAMAYKMSGNEEFFDSIVNNNQSLFNALAEAYGDDVNNWKTLAQAKADIDKSLISQLADMWGNYYGSFDANVVKGKDGQYSLINDDPTAVYESGYQAIEQEIAKRNQMVRSLNEAANVEIIIPDFGGIGSAGKKSGSGKDKKDNPEKFDWIERDLKLLNEQREKALNKASDTSIDYFGLTNEEFNRAKELFNDSTDMVGDKANELANFAKQAGISLSDLYTLIANGNPGESRENYLAQVLELDKTILPRTEQAVESYKKIWEDAASKISPENKAKIEQGYKDVETLPGAEAEGVQTAIDAYDKWQSIQDSYTESQKKNTDAIMAQYDNRINAINKENEQLEKTNSVLESRMDYLKSIGEIPSASLYENLISNTGTEISNTQKLISELKGKLKEARTKYGKDSEEYINLKENIDDAEASLYTTMQTQEKYNQALAQMPIDHLSTLISMYDDITAKIENWGSVQTATGTKLDGEYYQTLISNGTTIIGQYQKQIKEIKSLMSEYQEGSTIWQELYEQLQDIDGATASMLANLKKWNAELLAMPLDKINTYSDSLQKVISGLTDVRSELDSASSAITTAISDRIDLLQEEQKVAAEAHETEIDALEEKAEALKRVNEEAEKKLAVERAEYDLARARGQKSNLEIRDGERVYTENYDAVRQAQEAVANSKADLEEYNLQRQIEDARTALDNLNDGYQEQIDALEKISKKYSEISYSADKISKANLATSLFGEGFADKVLSGNDKEIYTTLTSLYQTNAKQLDEYQKQAESTSNIESLMSDYINSYKAGEITYDQALGKINGLLAQLNQNMSASTNLQNIYDYLGTVNGVGADADSILKGIKEGLSVTADNLIKSLEQYNKNSGMISEYTSSWQQLTDNVASMLDVMKDVRDNLRDSLDDYDRDDDDNDNTRYGGGKDGSPGTPGRGEYVNSGPGVEKRADGIKRGAIGSASDNDRVNMIKYLSTNDLKDGETPIIAHEGEVVLNSNQQEQLLDNVDTQPDSDREATLKLLGLKKLDADKIPMLLRSSQEVIYPEQQKKFAEAMKKLSQMNTYVPDVKIPNYSKMLQNINVKPQANNFSYSVGDITVNNDGEIEKEIMKGARHVSNSVRQKIHNVYQR